MQAYHGWILDDEESDRQIPLLPNSQHDAPIRPSEAYIR
jgi:hypothetical protein